MFNIGIFNVFSRIAANNVLSPCRNIFINAPLNFNLTNILLAEPPKKKKKMDPAILKMREERRQRRLGKVIRRLEKRASTLKPVFELEKPFKLLQELEHRKREAPNLTPETIEKRALLFKEWNRYKSAQHREHVKLIKKCMNKQLKALDEIKAISEELYLSTIQLDEDLLPFSAKGPVHTPPFEEYEPPQGDYIDITRQY